MHPTRHIWFHSVRLRSRSSAQLTALVASAAFFSLSLQAQTFDPAHAKASLLAQCPAMPALAADTPIHVDKWGSSGPSVLLIHGGVQGKLGGGPATFDKQKALGDMGWTVQRVDRPGFGSSPSRGPDDQQAAAVWAAAMLLDGGTNVIGHSFGGAISLLATAQRPGSVRSLILVEPGLQPLLTGVEEYASVAERNRSTAMQNLAEARTPGDYAIAIVKRVGTDGSGGPNLAVAELASDPKTAEGMGCALLRARTASAASLQAAAAVVVKAHIPVLVISGGYDPAVDQTDEAIAHILHGTYVKVQSPNHFVMLSNPTDFNRVVNDFMRKAGTVARSSTP